MVVLPLIALLVLQDTSTVRTRAVERAQRRAQWAREHAIRQESLTVARRLAGQAAMGDAYAGPATAALVANARERRERAERLVTRYQATVTQRIGVGIRALRRDRMLFGQEIAARIDWQRDGPTRVTALGARQRIPVALRGDQVPDLGDAFDWVVFDPSADYLRLIGDDDEGFAHPLREGGEADYRYAIADSAAITLPDGRVIRLIELHIRPRRADFNLMTGSLWFDADTYGMVRAVFAPARPFDFEVDAEPDDREDVPAWVKPIRAEVRYITMEYGLYGGRWWLPRYMSVDAEAQASVIRTPLRFERVYSDFTVEGGTPPLPGARRPAGSVRPEARDTVSRAAADSAAEAFGECMSREIRRLVDEEREARRQDGARVRVSVGSGRARRLCRDLLDPDQPWPIEIEVPDGDTLALLGSATLGEPILQMGDVISEDEIRGLAQAIGAIPERPWQARAQLPGGLGSLLQHARYNRVEALSLGLSSRVDFGRLELDALGRIGLADLEPNGELGLTRPASTGRFRFGAFRRLAAANPDTRPFGAVNSFSALVLGRDDGEYFRSYGLELTGEPAPTRANWWRLRVYAERQRPAVRETNASLPRLFDSGQLFRPNVAAQRAEQAGAAVSLRKEMAFGTATNVAGDAQLEAATGTFDFQRAAGSLRLTFPVAGAMAGLEGGAGSTAGAVPVQSLWYLGGPATLRGYDGGVLRGEAFWRARAEVATSWPAVRVALFGDAGWAGARTAFGDGRPLWSLGVGASMLDGIVRLDLAKGMRAPGGWRFDFYLDGLF